MKIISVSISNILSFPEKEDLNVPTVQINSEGNEGSLHVLIGPNGSGKSNFFEVLNQVFQKIMFRTLIFNENQIKNYQKTKQVNGLDQVLQIGPNNPASYLQKNYFSSVDSKKILLELELSDQDIVNILFVAGHNQQLNSLLEKFSKSGNPIQYRFSNDFDVEKLKQLRNIGLTIYDETPTNIFHLNINSNTEEKSFAIEYLQNFKLIKKLIYIYNKYEKTESDEEWPELRENFILLGAYRNYHTFAETADVNQDSEAQFRALDERKTNENTKSGDSSEPAIMELVRRKITYKFHEHKSYYGIIEAQKSINEYSFLSRINEKLKTFLNLKLAIADPDIFDLQYDIYFIDLLNNEKRLDFSGLSSGQKSIVHLIFTLLGYELDNGCIIIDEPELHLHPQMQESYLTLINEVKCEKNVQFVIATHSPIFVNSQTIKDTYRFYLDNKETKVVHPKIEKSEHSLSKILDFSNNSKIFFSKKAILVEGESDEYFYNFFIRKIIEKRKLQFKQSYEVFDINGKGSKITWRDFLESFQLDVSFIGDWDNIRDFKIDNAPRLAKLTSLSETDYAQIIKKLEINYQQVNQKINTEIDSLRQKRNYILKRGALEDYLGLPSKDKVKNVIDFCNNGFEKWQLNSSFDTYRLELEEIIFDILEK